MWTSSRQAAVGARRPLLPHQLEPLDQAFFGLADVDAAAAAAREDAKVGPNIVHCVDNQRSAAMPWLRRTDIPDHVRGLRKDEVYASFALPKCTEDAGDAGEPELSLMLEMDEVFAEAHSWCFDGPGCMLTWRRQLALSRFHAAATGKARGFDPKKGARDA